MTRRSIPQSLALSVIPVALVALASSYFTKANDAWYQTLAKPVFTPPQWAFPVAWGIVYFCIIVSLYLLLRSGMPDRPGIIGALALIGALNIGWSFVFFQLHAMIPAAVVLIVLLCTLTYLILSLYPIRKVSALLFAPHLIWGAFALVLNIGFILVN